MPISVQALNTRMAISPGGGKRSLIWMIWSYTRGYIQVSYGVMRPIKKGVLVIDRPMTWMVFLRVKVPKDTSFGRLRQTGGRDTESSEGEKSGNEGKRGELKRAKSHGAKRKRERAAVSKIGTDKCLKRQELQRNKRRSKESAKTTCSAERGLGGL